MPIAKAFLVCLLIYSASAALAEGPGLGQELSLNEIPSYARHALPDGTGLPPGSGNVAAGAQVYADYCAVCHGATGVEGPIMPPVAPNELWPKAAGRYWPHATTLFAYVKRAMPFNAPKSLSDDEVYSVVSFLLHRNGLLAEDMVLDARSLAAIEMPNRDNFIDVWERQGEKPW